MKHALPWVLFATACALEPDEFDTEDFGTIEQASNGDAWIQSDLLQPTPYKALADVAIGGQHQIFTVGGNANSIAYSTAWTFRTSTNGGITFTSGPSYSLAGEYARVQKIAVDPSGRIVVAGVAKDLSDRLHVVMRLSTDQGASFTTVDERIFPEWQYHSVSSLTVDASGQFTVAINGNTAEGDLAPTILRRSQPGGLSWSTLAHPMSGSIRGVCETSAGLVVTGSSRPFGGVFRGSTRRYANGVWTSLDSFPGGGTVCGEANGVLYVGGFDDNDGIVRRSANGGTTWTEVDRVYRAIIQDIGPGKNGRVYYVADGDNEWLVRRSENGTTWVESDRPGSGEATGYAFDPSNNATVVVGARNNVGFTDVRRLLP